MNSKHHSPEVDEVVSYMPHWIIRRGMILLLLFFSALIGFTAIFKYPDVITGEIRIISSPPPIPVISHKGGEVILIKADNSLVKKGDIIGAFRSDVDYLEVLSLEENLLNLRSDLLSNSEDLHRFIEITKGSPNYGALQSSFNSLIKNLIELQQYHLFIRENYNIDDIRKKINFHLQLNESLQKRYKNYQEQIQLIEAEFRIDSLLFAENVTTIYEYNQSKLNQLIKRDQLNNLKSEIITNKIIISELNIEIDEIFSENNKELKFLLTNTIATRNNLLSSIYEWKLLNLFEAPVSGTLSLNNVWSDYQYIDINERLATVVPNSRDYIGKLKLPITRSGKVKRGQRVNIKLSNYPFQEYGMLKGNISNISLIPDSEHFYIDVALENQLITTYELSLNMKHGLVGTAEIITNDVTLLERLFNNIIGSLKG